MGKQPNEIVITVPAERDTNLTQEGSSLSLHGVEACIAIAEIMNFSKVIMIWLHLLMTLSPESLAGAQCKFTGYV